MSNQGQPTTSGAKAFQKKGQSRALGKAIPLGFLALGSASAAVAVATAVSPAQSGAMVKASEVLDRVGLDKGPLLMFGLLSAAMGLALSRIDRAKGGDDPAAEAVEISRANGSNLEMQSAILGSLQAEVGGLRNEFSDARREAKEAQEKDAGAMANGEVSDPLFRLAASLDQLGAQIDKRIDKARREMLDAVAGVKSSVEVTAEQNGTGADETLKDSVETAAKEVEATRLDIADLRGQLAGIAEAMEAVKGSVAKVEGQLANVPAAAPAAAKQESMPQPQAMPEATPGAEASPISMPVALPVELTDAAESSEAPEAPAAPIPAPAPEESAAPTEPRFEGFSHDEDTRDASHESQESEAPAQKLGVDMESLGFPEPPAALPKPAEGLNLIDQMDDDTARAGDITPPLFPDVHGEG